MKNNVIIENGKYGLKAVITSTWSEDVAKYLIARNIAELELNESKGWKGSDLSFLYDFSCLKSFEIIDLRPSIQDISPVNSLKNLKRLDISTYCSTEINFFSFQKLEFCSLEWGKRKAQTLFDCTSLKELFLNRYNGKDTAPFSNLVNLESLAILNAPIEDLKGVGQLKMLKILRLARLKKLSSLSGIEGLRQLEELEIDTCSSIDSIKEISHLSNLKKLSINNNGKVESLKPLEGLSDLESVLFWESTDIIDGDLTPLLNKKLSRVSFQNRRHYSHKREDFGAAYLS